MTFIGGDIVEVSYKHKTLGTGTWSVVSNQDSENDPGGLRSEDDDNSVTGDGQNIVKMNRVRWSKNLVIAWDQNGTDEVEKARQLAGNPEDADWTFTHMSGAVWGGRGRPVGDIKGNTNSAQFPVKISGGGRLSKIS